MPDFTRFDQRHYRTVSVRDGYRDWAGMPTHFENFDGEPIAVETFTNLFSEHVAAARDAGLTARELHERVVDDDWIMRKPQRGKYRGWPTSFAWVWAR